MSSRTGWDRAAGTDWDWLGGRDEIRTLRSELGCLPGSAEWISVEFCHVTSQHSVPNICKHRSSCVTPCGQMWRFFWQSHQLISLSVTICVKQSALVTVWRLFQSNKKYHLRPNSMWHFIVWLLRTVSRLLTKACHVCCNLLDRKPQNEMYRKLPVCKSEHKSFSHLTYSQTQRHLFTFAVRFLYCP